MHPRQPIRELAASGRSIRAITRELGISRNTVRRALDPSRPDRYSRAAPLDEWVPAIRESLERYPRMAATDVARRVRYDGGMTAFSVRVRSIRREVLHGGPRAPG